MHLYLPPLQLCGRKLSQTMYATDFSVQEALLEKKMPGGGATGEGKLDQNHPQMARCLVSPEDMFWFGGSQSVWSQLPPSLPHRRHHYSAQPHYGCHTIFWLHWGCCLPLYSTENCTLPSAQLMTLCLLDGLMMELSLLAALRMLRSILVPLRTSLCLLAPLRKLLHLLLHSACTWKISLPPLASQRVLLPPLAPWRNLFLPLALWTPSLPSCSLSWMAHHPLLRRGDHSISLHQKGLHLLPTMLGESFLRSLVNLKAHVAWKTSCQVVQGPGLTAYYVSGAIC